MLRKTTIFKASTHELIEAHLHDKLGDIHSKLCNHNAVVIVNPEGDFLGIVTRKDAIEAILSNADWKNIPLREIMTHKVLHIPNHVSLAEAAEIMINEDIHQLVITGPPEGGSVAVGIVTLQDVLKNAI